MTSLEIEIALAKSFNPRANLILPNAYWGLDFSYELDLLVINKKSKYATEIEIKVSKSDLKRDKNKLSGHSSEMIKRLYFAIPESISEEFALEHIPERAGLIAVRQSPIDRIYYTRIIRNAKFNKYAQPVSDKFYLKAAELAALRIWKLKRTIMEKKLKE